MSVKSRTALADLQSALSSALIALERAKKDTVEAQSESLAPRVFTTTISGDAVYQVADLMKIVELLSGLGVPESYYRLALFLENWTSDTLVGTSLTGSFRGLGQFSRRTWNNLKQRDKLDHIPVWEQGVHDPKHSLEMLGRLYLSNKKVFKNHFPNRDYTDEIAYLYHQQGASAARKYLQTGKLVYPKQSTNSLVVLDHARKALFGGRSTASLNYPNWV